MDIPDDTLIALVDHLYSFTIGLIGEVLNESNEYSEKQIKAIII